MNKNKQNKQASASDSGVGKEAARVVRYVGAEKIEEMMGNEQYIEAFAHTQLGIEKILWDRIVEIFEGEKAMKVREELGKRKGEDKSNTRTAELIKWANFLGAINDNEYSDLIDFNKKRNNITHGHGQWWYSEEEYKEALKKGIRFLSENGFK